MVMVAASNWATSAAIDSLAARCAYSKTKMGLPYTLTQRWYENDETVENYLNRAYTDVPLYNQLAADQWDVRVYSSNAYLAPSAIGVFRNVINAETTVGSYPRLFARMMRFAGYRYVPHLLKPCLVFYSGDLEFERAASTEAQPYYKDNYIGSSKQINRPSDSWVQFFRDSRLAPQFRKASSYFDSSDQKRIRYLLDHLDEYLPEPEHASVLHGDLWCGNYIIGNDGEAWLIDPAVYLGHSEADLAMTELFGGFPREFYSAYDEVNPIDREYVQRRDLYNLYHILNHLNLFGGSYLWEVKRVLRQFDA